MKPLFSCHGSRFTKRFYRGVGQEASNHLADGRPPLRHVLALPHRPRRRRSLRLAILPPARNAAPRHYRRDVLRLLAKAVKGSRRKRLTWPPLVTCHPSLVTALVPRLRQLVADADALF